MIFWNDAYRNEIDKFTNYINREYRHLQDEPMALASAPDNIFFDLTLIDAWNHFVFLYDNNREKLESNTLFNQKHLQQRALITLEGFNSNKLVFLSTLLRIIYEYNFWVDDPSTYPECINFRVLERLDFLSKDSIHHGMFIWIERVMPARIARDIIKSNEFASVKTLSENVIKQHDNIQKQCDSFLDEFNKKFIAVELESAKLLESVNVTKTELVTYEEKLTGYKNQYNFVLLSHGYKKLSDQKKKSLLNTRIVTWLFSFMLLLAPIITLLNSEFNWISIGAGLASLSFYLPLATFEIIIFYFLRLYYSEVHSIQTQLLQIDQRLSLCEFIHDYVDKRSATSDHDSWKMFETLIFSPIQMSKDNIPSILDGANVLADVAGKIISKGK
ncbi:hypothetical protein [Enterobacter bugandensis]|uniref:hypothetical protein n=1 Tax=Enterobacter bugandensis TaxID=881260 RepID=UPI0013D6233E|nr:hypothetical protein [Enterobacter bugandensis]